MRTYKNTVDGREICDCLDRDIVWITEEYGPGFVEVIPAPPTIGSLIARALFEIDADTDSIYGAVLGNRGPEYLDAEAAAQAYKDALYTGTVPEDVQSYATAMGWTAQQAADDILLTAANWRPAKSTIRANRLAAKEAVRDSKTISEVEAVLAWWAIFVVAIRGQLGL